MNITTNVNINANPKILCIIPARSGSKGIPNKNIKSYRGKPLMAWSIEQAQKSKHPMRIIVSTDSEEYAEIARKYGAEVPFLRPSEISQDLSTDYECIRHVLERLRETERYISNIVVQLRPTYPTRKVEDLDRCLDIYLSERQNGYTSLRTVIPYDKSPYKMYRIGENGKHLQPLFEEVDGLQEPYNRCRQELPQCYLHNGCIDIMETSTVMGGSVTGNKIYAYTMDPKEIKDIDYIKDWDE
jgi:CMP-N,N'-diacetyllegionaminic acid synthase